MDNNDIIRNTMISLTAATPDIGGSISVILDKIIPSEIEMRSNAFLLELDKNICTLRIQIDNTRWNDPLFKSRFIKIINEAISEHIYSRRIMYQNIVINLLAEKCQLNEEDFYIHLTNRLSNYSIQFLYSYYINQPDKKFFSLFRDYDALHQYIIEGAAECARYRLINNGNLTEFGQRYCKYIFSPVGLINK